MKNAKAWKPTKLRMDSSGAWVPNASFINPASQHTINIQAQAYIKAIKKYARGDLLDCGSGTAPFYSVYKSFADKVTCIDWDQSPHNTSHADDFTDLNNGLPYNDALFDTVLLSDVLEHIHSPLMLIKDISRVLKPRGNLICFVPFMYWIHEEPNDYHRYTKFALERLCQKSGLKVVELEAYGGGPDVLIDTALKLSRKRPHMTWFLLSVSRTYSKSRHYKRMLAKSKNKMPLGYSLVARKP